uniref:CNH domain-containing protein n=1 Tax=Schistosoma curassoni TaxID=6186 RepID=A0A183L246_9TREM
MRNESKVTLFRPGVCNEPVVVVTFGEQFSLLLLTDEGVSFSFVRILLVTPFLRLGVWEAIVVVTFEEEQFSLMLTDKLMSFSDE